MAQKKPNKKGLSRDELEMDEAYYGLTGRKPKEKKRKSSMVYLAIGLAALLVIVIGLGIGLTLKANNRTLGPVRIGSLNLEGLTAKQARAQLNDLAKVYENTPMTVTVMEQVITLSPEGHISKLDVDAVLRDAKKVSPKDGETNLDIIAYLGVDETSIRQTLLPLEQAYGVAPSKTQWSVTGQDPNPDDPLDPGSKKLVVTMGVPDYGLDMNKLYQLILQGYRLQDFDVTMECSVVEPEIPNLKEIYALVCTDSADAIVDEKTFEITPEVYGYGFDLAAAADALENCPYGETREFPFLPKVPKYTQEMAEKELYGDILGEYKTPHTPESNRNVNLRLACEAINGTIVLPGETFSYNKTLGERTTERGYKPAASYVNGLTVDTVGGGICQVSSTLYYVCLLSDMDITVRSPHGYVSSYIPKGMDAAVSWGYQDYKFKNNKDTPVRIEAWMEDGYVNVRLWGHETRDYYVELTYEELSSQPYDVVYKEYAPNNKEGYQHGDVVITPYTGCSVKTYKKLIDRETGKTIDTVYITKSNYNKRDKVICLIVDPTQTTPPETTPPESSPADTTPPEAVG